MREKISALKRNETWDLVPLPAGVKQIDCKWVYKVKRRSDGSVERARLIARGFSQQYGIHYDETFSPAANGKDYCASAHLLRNNSVLASMTDGRKKCLSLWCLSTPFSCLQSSLHSHHTNCSSPHSIKPTIHSTFQAQPKVSGITECFLSRSAVRTIEEVKGQQ